MMYHDMQWHEMIHSIASVIRVVRLTTLHCTPSCDKFVTNMQNRLVHHLIGTKIHCARSLSTIKNTIVTLCEIRRERQNDFPFIDFPFISLLFTVKINLKILKLFQEIALCCYS